MTGPDDTATIERDLRAVDDALAGDAAAHDDPLTRELQELALALRADAPQPRPEFASDLRARVDAGFSRERSTRRRLPFLPRVNLAPVAGVVGPLLLIAVVIFAAGPSATTATAAGRAAAAAGVPGSERRVRRRRQRRARVRPAGRPPRARTRRRTRCPPGAPARTSSPAGARGASSARCR